MTTDTLKAPDVTAGFIKQLRQNGAVAKKKGGEHWPVVGAPRKLYWFKGQVQNKGPWDFKNNIYKKHKKTGLVICGTHYKNDMPGNFHYGFVGAAADIPDQILFQAAGAAQLVAGTTKPKEFSCTYGDDPIDHDFIRLGIKLFDDHGLSFTQAMLKTVLRGFSPKNCSMTLQQKQRIREMTRISGRPKI